MSEPTLQSCPERAALFLQATIAALGALSVLLFSERSLDPARSAFVAAAAVPAGSVRDRELATSERVQTEIDQLKKAEHDLVVLSTHGRTGLSHLLLGSIAEKLVRLSPVPVLTVPLRGRS